MKSITSAAWLPLVALGGVSLAVLLWPPPAHARTVTHVPLYTFHGEERADQFGISVSGAGDVNGDGRADLIVGASRDATNGTDSGSASVFSGLDGSTLYKFNGVDPGDHFGISVSGASDVNGDGQADLIVGAFRDDSNGPESGSARVFSGLDGRVLYTFNGDEAGDKFGGSVSGAGDVNGDGRPDLIVGASADDNDDRESGGARVLSGLDGSTLYTFDQMDNRFGWSVNGAGDVNGDGRADLIVGVSGDDNNGPFSGSARVLSGLDGSTLYTFDGDDAYDQFGASVSVAGDVNGDGQADLIVGAFRDDNNGPDSGSARVLSGLDGSTLYTFDGDDWHNWFGWSVSGAGDVNGDGRADLIVGAIFDDNIGFNPRNARGSARVLSGLDGRTLYTFDGDDTGDRFGNSVSGAGDVNGDGLDDFIVGAIRGGLNGGGYARVFVSQIVPEPHAAAMLAAAACGLLTRRRRG